MSFRILLMLPAECPEIMAMWEKGTLEATSAKNQDAR